MVEQLKWAMSAVSTDHLATTNTSPLILTISMHGVIDTSVKNLQGRGDGQLRRIRELRAIYTSASDPDDI
jgi:hypothetical protein